MTVLPLRQITIAPVPARAMTTALVLAGKLGNDIQPSMLVTIARDNGGDEGMAQAIGLRLNMLAMLLTIDPAINIATAKLGAGQIGAVVAEIPVGVREGCIDFDGDALAAALWLAADPVGAA